MTVTLQPLSISHSQVSSFAACRRKWDLEQKWQSTRYVPALVRGSAVHAGLDAYYSGNRDPGAGMLALDVFIEKDRQEQMDMNGYVMDNYDETMDLARRMLQHYFETPHSNPIIREGKILMVEKKVGIGVGKHKLNGRIDLVLEWNNQIWIVDHKTYSQVPNAAGLEVDDQLTSYCYQYWRLSGVVPTGVLYNILVTKVPGPPGILKNGGLSQAKDQGTTYDLYVRELERLGLPWDKYQGYLDYLKGVGTSEYFVCQSSSRNLQELQAYGRRVEVQANFMAAAKTNPKLLAYPSPSSGTCGWCPFLAPCKAMDDGGDAEALLSSQYRPNVRLMKPL